MDYTEPQFWPQLIGLAGNIDNLDYYQVLNLAQTATPQEIKGSYYQLARALHPDKFYTIPDETVKRAVGKIYRRVTEAYSVLSDEGKRKIYTADINGPDRVQKLRFTEESEQEKKQKEREAREVAKTPQGKKMYNAAVADIQGGRLDKALKNLKSALLFEAGNETITALKAEVEAKLKEGG